MMFLFCLFSSALGQQIGAQKTEYHPPFNMQSCTKEGCVDDNGGSITIDANWRWLHKLGDYQPNCYTGNTWNADLCPDPQTCTKNCALEGADQQTWTGTYGIKPYQGGAQLDFVTHGQYSTNIGSRVFLMDSDSKYKMFKLVNKEFTFDVDVSNLPCGLNGALYFVEMKEDGGSSSFPTNKCGAKFGTGYCDAQCPHDIKWINGEANNKDWKPSPTDKNAGTGHYGTCCAEMDIWESNSLSSAFTPHPCDVKGHTRCEGSQCGDNGDDRYKGLCDKDGCDLNAWRSGVKDFFGPGSGFKVDTTKPMTVVTQFISSDGTDNGDLTEIKRFFVQNGQKIEHAMTNVPGVTPFNSLTDKNCYAQKAAFNDTQDFQRHGGMKSMGQAMQRGMVLVMSLWDDHYARMLWLDSSYPLDKDPSKPGINRGSCSTDSGKPEEVESQHGDAHVMYYNVKFGDIGTTTQFN